MTRHEQILSEVHKHFINDTTHIASKINAFVDGAKWADEHPKPGMVNKQEFIEKLEKWIRNNTDWTGTRVETNWNCDSVDKFVDAIFEDLKYANIRINM